MAIAGSGPAYDGDPSGTPDELKYRSENKTPSIEKMPRRLQHSPEFMIGPQVISPTEPPDAVGDEDARMTEGDNPAPMRPTVSYSQNCEGCPGETNLTAPKNTSSAAVSAYLSSGGSR